MCGFICFSFPKEAFETLLKIDGFTSKQLIFSVQVQKKQNTAKICFNQVLFSKQDRYTISNYIEAIESDQTGPDGNTRRFSEGGDSIIGR